MARFMTRVELHGAKEADYTTLHAAMEAAGFSRTIKADSGVWYHLPTAEYDRTCELNAQQVVASAKAAASQTGKASSIITTEWTVSRWDGLIPVESPA